MSFLVVQHHRHQQHQQVFVLFLLYTSLACQLLGAVTLREGDVDVEFVACLVAQDAVELFRLHEV